MNTTPENHYAVGQSNLTATSKVEYRVRPITRYIVTRHVDTGNTGSTTERGQFDNYQTAYDVAYAMCKLEHDMEGSEPDDERFQYPKHSQDEASVRVRGVKDELKGIVSIDTLAG